MHRLAATAAGSSSTLCLPGLPSASVATNFAQDQQNTWKMLMNVKQHMISFQTGLKRALETATVAATATRGAAHAAQGSGSQDLLNRVGAKRQIWPEHKQDPSNQRVARQGAQVL